MIYGKEVRRITDKLGEQGIQLSLDGSGAFTIYRRKGGFPEGDVEKFIEDSGDVEFIVYPIHPIQVEVSTHLMIRLIEPLIVAPRSNLKVYVRAPIGAGIYATEGKSHKLIDFFGPAPFKYALYGTPASGTVCRFHRTEASSGVPQPKLWEAVTMVSMENTSGEFVEVRNIVYPLLNADIYVDGDGGAYVEAAHLLIENRGVGRVTLKNEAPLSGLRKCPQPFAGTLEKVGRFLMEFGL